MKQYRLRKEREELAKVWEKFAETLKELIESLNKEAAEKLAIQYFVVILKNCKSHQIDQRFVYKLQIFSNISDEIKNLINTFESKDEYSQSVLSFLDNVNNVETNLTYAEVLQMGNLHELEADLSKY